MTEVVEVLVRALVDNPDEVIVEEDGRKGDTVFVKVTVAPGDMGRVIGRGGKIANAIRTVANASGARNRQRAMIDFTN